VKKNELAESVGLHQNQ